MKSHIRYIFYLLLLLLIGNSSCRDDMFNDMYGTADGYSRIKLSYSFDSFHPTGIGSRSYGDMYDAVRNLWVVVYKQSDEGGDFTLYEGYPKQIYKSASSDTSDPSSLPGSNHPNDISNSISLPAGTYQLYAVANIDNFDNKYKDQISTPADLKAIDLKWQQTDQGIPSEDNDQMFGYFSAGTSTTAEGDKTDPATITVGTGSLSLHADLVRAASKVTVAYDGSQLAEGISIYIKSVSIKNIPLVCSLGNPNKIESAGDLTDGETVSYKESDPGANFPYPVITKDNPYFPRRTEPEEGSDKTPTYAEGQDPHSHTSENSLFFYENLQGTDPALDKSAFTETDGTPDQFNYEAKPYATYIEVATHYISENPENPMVSDIVYRFMLGTNITDNFDAIRNYHYKLTLRFIGTTPEADWRIDYVNVLGVTQPKPVNYKGQQFDLNSSFLNGGHDFNPNTFVVTSFQYNSKEESKKKPLEFKFEYGNTDEDGNFVATKKPEWVDNISYGDPDKDGKTICTINYTSNPKTYQGEGRAVTLKTLLESNTQDESDLSKDADGTMTTANCYIVNAKGTYTFPLVYGNAIKGGATNSSAYTDFGGWADDKTVSQIVDESEPYEITVGDKKEMTLPAPKAINTLLNYKNERISSPYILTDISDAGNISASLVWQDVEGLIDPASVDIDKSTYGATGGITFTIGENIDEGNAVLAVKDGTGKIMWSWHIWVTSLDLDFLVPVTNNIWMSPTPPPTNYEIMPVNLGWCSNGEEVVYYVRHECEVRVTQILKGDDGNDYDGYSQTITIVQEPHIDVPMGNNTYYQWGRKDPFVGTNERWTSKNWYLNINGNMTEKIGYIAYNENDFTNDGPHSPNNRKPTIEIIGDLIQNPQMFNNPRRHGYVGKEEEGVVWDQIYTNLWANRTKTVYDPCPVGFQVSPKDTFTGFTVWANAWYNQIMSNGICVWDEYLYSVLNANMPDKYNNNAGLFGFYTNYVPNETKLISLGFPLTGYLDYDAVVTYHVGNHSYIWTNQYFNSGNSIEENNNAYNFKAALIQAGVSVTTNFGQTTPENGVVNPLSSFYTTDGFAVRPTRIISQ